MQGVRHCSYTRYSFTSRPIWWDVYMIYQVVLFTIYYNYKCGAIHIIE